MKSPLFEGVDYVHRETRFLSDGVRECTWNNSFVGDRELQNEFPLQLRRERYHRSIETLHRHHDFYALYFVRAGRGLRVFNEFSRSMARGDVFLMPPGNLHCFARPENLTMDSFYFQKCLWSEREWSGLFELAELANYLSPEGAGTCVRAGTDFFGHLPPEIHSEMESRFAQMRRLLNQRKLAPHLAAKGQLFGLLLQLAEWRQSKSFKVNQTGTSKLAEILVFCEQNFHRPICNEQLARMMHFSEGHFRAVFTKEMGVTPGAYINYLRLQRAQELLKDASLSFSQIAHLSGFGEPDQMGRAFRKSLGVSPSAFRKKLKTSG